MPTYILDPSGKVIKDGEENPPTASAVSKEILENQNDYFSDRRKNNDFINTPSSNFLPSGLKGLVTGSPGHNIVSVESGIIETDTETGKENYFPSKTNSENNKNLLVNPSFGYDKDNPIKYYHQFNSIFSENERDRVIYAEELEMIAGVELNSLGLILQFGDGLKSDISLISYLFDYIIESIIYLATSYVFINNTSLSRLAPDPIKDYFNNLLHLRHDMKDRSFLTLVNYFIIGFDKYINTDSKYNAFKLDYDGTENFIEIIGHYLANTITNISKVGRNRFFLLARKFQQESYWHSEILYKAKEDSDENPIDKFFIEFSQYYFKFMLERINIGYLSYNKYHQYKYKSNEKTRTFESSRFGFDTKRNKKDLKLRLENANEDIIDDNEQYSWSQRHVINKSKFKTSITALPQLLKSNEYFKHNISKSSSKLIHQNFTESNKSSKRLPIDLVKKIEDSLENEYMPFYMHDLRTNEVISMHAFLDSITDSFSPEYTSSTGYGRIDDVKHYVKTTRSIGLTFSLVSMQEEDFDLMWYQINKIVSMVYPQWSQGVPSNTGKFKSIEDFRFPFTQVPTASPLIRLRVGDILKSNYSLENLKRLHGNNKKSIKSSIPIVNFIAGSTFAFKARKLSSDEILDIITILNHSISGTLGTLKIKVLNDIFDIKEIIGQSYNLIINEFVFEDQEEKSNKIKLNNNQIEKVNYYDFLFDVGLYNKKDYPLLGTLSLSNDINDSWDIFRYYKTKDDYYYVFSGKDNRREKTLFFNDTVLHKDVLDNNIFSSDVDGSVNNPYTKSFETASGKGLAGFITSLSIDYQNQTWNVNSPGSNATHGVKITLGFAPVHDIPPGLDHDGLMRSSIYNVGSVNNAMFK